MHHHHPGGRGGHRGDVGGTWMVRIYLSALSPNKLTFSFCILSRLVMDQFTPTTMSDRDTMMGLHTGTDHRIIVTVSIITESVNMFIPEIGGAMAIMVIYFLFF